MYFAILAKDSYRYDRNTPYWYQYFKHRPSTVAHTFECVCSKINHGIKSWVINFTFESYKLPHTLNCMCVSLFKFHIWNFRAVLALPKTARSAETHKSISFIWIVWSTLYVYLCQHHKPLLLPAEWPIWSCQSKLWVSYELCLTLIWAWINLWNSYTVAQWKTSLLGIAPTAWTTASTSMMTNMEVGKVDPQLELPEVCMRAGKSAKKVGKKTS